MDEADIPAEPFDETEIPDIDEILDVLGFADE